MAQDAPVRKAGMSYTQFSKYAAHMFNHPETPAKVPCGTCHACCYHKRIDVYPAQEPAERLAHLDLVADPFGELKLNKRPDGACVHLTEQGKCGVYEHRPNACRQYDCRVFSFVGMNIDHGNGRKEPVWQFDARTTADKIYQASIMFLRDAYQSDHPGDVTDLNDLLKFITEHIVPAKDLMTRAWKQEEEMVQNMTRNERKAYHREMEAMVAEGQIAKPIRRIAN